ncbi:hypothetical protein EDC01DRAFT_776018 [Geopyxis carbonaria]|nr:hypothetical protein EDC01DRAFT_776018 [Geopyxis carbonaria]
MDPFQLPFDIKCVLFRHILLASDHPRSVRALICDDEEFRMAFFKAHKRLLKERLRRSYKLLRGCEHEVRCTCSENCRAWTAYRAAVLRQLKGRDQAGDEDLLLWIMTQNALSTAINSVQLKEPTGDDKREHKGSIPGPRARRGLVRSDIPSKMLIEAEQEFNKALGKEVKEKVVQDFLHRRGAVF